MRAVGRCNRTRLARFYIGREDIDALVEEGLDKVRVLCYLELRDLYQEVIIDHSRKSPELRQAGRGRTGTRRGSIRSAASYITLYRALRAA